MNRTTGFKLALSVLMTTMCWSPSLLSSALAQTFPAQSNPGLQTPAPTEQVDEQKRQLEQKYAPSNQDEEPRQTIDVPEGTPSVQIEVPRFMASKIVVEDMTVLSPSEVHELTKGYEGREITLEELQALVEQINEKYREKGYLTTQAYVPPQEVEAGTVTIKVVEGTVGNLCVAGNRFYRPSAILRSMSVEPGQVFNLRDLEHDLNLSNRLYNYRVKATLSPGEDTGETDIRIDVQEKQPWQIVPSYDNQGRPYIGMYRPGVEVVNDSLFGFGDRLYTRFIGADGTRVGLGSYFVPINKRGDQIGISYGYSNVDVDLPNFSGDIDGRAHSFGLLYTRPFDEDRVWVGDIGFNVRQIRSFVNNAQTGLDQIRSLQAGINYDNVDSMGRMFARLQTSLGVDVLGGNAQFWKMEGFVNRLFTLPKNNVLIIRGYGQFTPNDLPTAEQFQVGGAYSVRGYTEGLLIGDRGYQLTIEDRWPIPFLASASPWLAERLQGAVFFDVGQTWLDKSSPRYISGFSNSSQRTSLVGAGFGLRARLSQYLQGFMDVGFGLVNRDAVEPNGQPTARIHFGIRSNTLPESYRAPSDRVECQNASGEKPKTGWFRRDKKKQDAEKSSSLPAALPIALDDVSEFRLK